MYIHEAIKASDREFPCITREAWTRIQDGERRALVYLCPTNTPDNVIADGAAGRLPSRGWQPKLEDLIAKDWMPADGLSVIKLCLILEPGGRCAISRQKFSTATTAGNL